LVNLLSAATVAAPSQLCRTRVALAQKMPGRELDLCGTALSHSWYESSNGAGPKEPTP